MRSSTLTAIVLSPTHLPETPVGLLEACSLPGTCRSHSPTPSDLGGGA